MLLYWLWLTTRRGLGCRAIVRLLEAFESPRAIYYASEADYRLAGMEQKELAALADKSMDEPNQIEEACREKDIHILTFQDANYPSRLRNIPDPPALLYYRGTLPSFDDEPIIAVVGTRRATAYGMTCAKRMGQELALCGGVLVSGMAMGIDGMAMIGAISQGRSVIGVLAGGVDVVYPKGNRSLYDDLLRRGCILSEYPPGTPPLPGNFPVRNRIISGLALGVVVIEAPERSGALITARTALDQGRDLFALPGNVGVSSCVGSNRLIKDGAAVAECGWDVMSYYADDFPGKIRAVRCGCSLVATAEEMTRYGPSGDEEDVPRRKPKKGRREPDCADPAAEPPGAEYLDVQSILPSLQEAEQKIVLALRERPLHIDDLIDACGQAASKTLASLTLLEVEQYIVRLPGNRYELARKSS